MELLHTSLAVNRERLERAFRLPHNIGIELRPLKGAHREGLLLWIDRFAPVQNLPEQAHDLLQRCLEEGPGAASQIAIPLRLERTTEFAELVDRVCAGWIALLVDQTAEALLIKLPLDMENPLSSRRNDAKEEVFSRNLRFNIALMRERIRTPNLLALKVPVIRPERTSGVALVYLETRAAPSVVRAVRRWAAKHLGEEAIGRGTFNGAQGVFGLLPRFTVTTWANKAATMIELGYVVVVVDRSDSVYIAPVTLAGWLTSASDAAVSLPMRRWLVTVRMAFVGVVLFLPGSVVSLLNYHQEMIPTVFLLAAGSARENAPFATFFEVLLLEMLTELSREASFRLPLAIPIGQSTLVCGLVIAVATFVGFVGPLPAIAALVGGLASLALPDAGLAYMVRVWRLTLLLGANILGFFGMATVFALFLAYLSQAVSWGVPFLGPSGKELTAPESWSSRPPRAKGGKGHAKGQAVVR